MILLFYAIKIVKKRCILHRDCFTGSYYNDKVMGWTRFSQADIDGGYMHGSAYIVRPMSTLHRF